MKFFSKMVSITVTLLSFLTLFIPTETVFTQDGSYSEDFEDGNAQGWELTQGWKIIEENGNHVLSGAGHYWAYSNQDFVYCQLSFRIKVISGDIHLVYRLNDEGRYFIRFNSSGSWLNKQYFPNDFHYDLEGKNIQHKNNAWHQVEISGQGDTITISVDGKTELTYTDLEPLEYGSFAFETLDGSQAYIDDVVVMKGDNKAKALETKTPETKADEIKGTETTMPSKEVTWMRTGGPLGGLGYDVRMSPDNPDKMLVSDAYAGIFMSQDGGKNWFPSNSGIDVRDGSTGDAIPVFSVTFDPSQPNIVWLGMQNRLGIYKSTDGGETWKKMINGISERDGTHFRGFTVDPANSDVVYAAAEISSWAGGKPARQGREFDLTRGVVYKTKDGGKNWKAIWRGENLARYIWIDPRDRDVLYISTGIFDREANNSDPEKRLPGGEGILKSTDGGGTWTYVNNGLNNLYVGSLFMHPTNPDILLAGTGNNQYYNGGGVYITTNGGEIWRKVLSDFAITSVEFAQSNPSIAYAGSDRFIYRSDDGGSTWRKVSGSESGGWGTPTTRGGFPIDFQVDPRNPERIFVNAYGGGNFLSEDGGKTWKVASHGYTGSMIRAISVYPDQPGRVLVGARSGLFYSLNGGEDWEGICPPPIFFMEWDAATIDPANSKHLITCSRGDFVIAQSFDNGISWKIVKTLVEDADNLVTWNGIEFAPSDPKIVYAGTTGFVRITPFDFSGYGKGVFKSIDGGTTWKPANDALSQDAHVKGIAVDPKNPNRVFIATTNHGLLLSNDGGDNWQEVKGGLPGSSAISIAINPDNPDFIAAGIESRAVYISTDGGSKWRQSASGMPAEASLNAIVFDPANPDEVMYAGDFFSGVYQSTNGGKKWELINHGLLNRAIQRLAISGDGLHLYAGTEGGGVFRLDFNYKPPVEATNP